MGIDCKITLPDTARLRDVANAIGILSGLEARARKDLGGKSFFVAVPGVKTGSYGSEPLASCARIQIEAPAGENLICGYPSIDLMYHFEWGSDTDDPDIHGSGRGIMPRSTAFGICLGRRLVDTFGGWVDYADCDDEYKDYEIPANPLNGASNGDAWDKQQRRIFDLKPITNEELKAAKKWAAYK